VTQLETLIEEIPKYQPGADLDVLERAYRFSAASHQGQQRASGEPYLSHPLEVANLLVDFKMDVTTVTAGLLHDVLEDTTATKADLEREFGGRSRSWSTASPRSASSRSLRVKSARPRISGRCSSRWRATCAC
jgi:(p)ppGpp synthase/HD superfamily hydrolase